MTSVFPKPASGYDPRMSKGRRLHAVWGLAALAGCGVDASSPEQGNAVAAPLAAESIRAPAAASGGALGEWLVGSWSFDSSCATDFIIRYDADGRLDNAGEVGRWSLEGEELTETVSERFENGGEESVKLDPPVVRRYALRRTDASHGTILFEGRTVPILRC